MLQFIGNLRGLRVQLLLWTVLPLTVALAATALIGITTHQTAMRQMVEQLSARSARLAAAQLNDRIEERAALLSTVLTERVSIREPSVTKLFDGGLAQLDAVGRLQDGVPTLELWQTPPMSGALAGLVGLAVAQPGQPAFSVVLPHSDGDRVNLLIAIASETGEVVGAVSLDELGLARIADEAGAAKLSQVVDSPYDHSQVAVFLVDHRGQVIYHPDPAQRGLDLSQHEGVIEVIQSRSGATYHREPAGQELVVGYAPVIAPRWGLVVQEDWETWLAPTMRLSLWAPMTAAVALLISGLAIVFGLHYVIHPLQMLDRQATRVAWGDFAAVQQPVGGVQEIEDLRRTLESMADQIQRYQSGMRDYLAAVTTAQEEERKRLARELHDETVQSLIALGHQVELVQKVLDRDPTRARQRLTEIRTLIGNTQEEVRRFSRALRPLYLEDLGFVPALEMLAQETARASGLSISFSVEGEVRRLSPDLELTAYRIAQEGLSNVIRHAMARSARLGVSFNADGLQLHLQDDGRGFQPPLNPADLAQQGHYGLMGIRERALLFRGRMEIHSQPGAGTMLEVFLPAQ